MEESRATEYLVHFGLSRQEALVYEQLLAGGKQTGYEIARDTGISRATLTSLYYDRNSAVSLQTLGTLCAYLGREVGDLISYTNQKEETP